VREIEERSLEAINGVGNKRYTSTPKSTCLQFSLRLTNYPPDGCCPLHGHSTTSSTVAFLATRSIMLWIKTARPLDLAKIAYSLDGSRYDFAWYPRWCRFPFVPWCTLATRYQTMLTSFATFNGARHSL